MAQSWLDAARKSQADSSAHQKPPGFRRWCQVLRGLLLGLILLSFVVLQPAKRNHLGLGLGVFSVVGRSALVAAAAAADPQQLADNHALNFDKKTGNLSCTWSSRVIYSLAYTNLKSGSANASAEELHSKLDFDKACNVYASSKNKDEAARVHFFSQPVLSERLNKADSGSGSSKEADYLIVNILDFTISYSNAIHIDLANYKKLVANPAFLDYKRKVTKTGEQSGIRLVFNLVTRTFITFRILNLPNDNKHFSEIVFLLNGDCSLDLFEKSSSSSFSSASSSNFANSTSSSSSSSTRPTITVLHSPYYDVLPSSAASSVNNQPRPATSTQPSSQFGLQSTTRTGWFTYLLTTFYSSPSAASRLKSGPVVYVERLLKFCAINHVRVDLESLVMSSVKYIREKRSDAAYEANLVQVSEKLVDTDKLMNKCTYTPSASELLLKKTSQDDKPKASAEDANETGSTPVNTTRPTGETTTTSESLWNKNAVHHHANSFNQIYLFEIENNYSSEDGLSDEDEMSTNYLRIFLKECDLNKQYLLIFYSNDSASAKSKKVFLDDSNCPITIKSNVMIYDTLNEPHPWLERYPMDEQVGGAHKEEFLKSQIASKLTLSWFFYMKIASYINEIEVAFITESSRSMTAPHRFFNRIQQRVFFERDFARPSDDSTDVQRNLKEQYSLKFTIPESDVLEYFTNRYLNLYQFLKDENHQNDPAFKKQFLAKKQFELNYRYFFVTNKKCRVVYLNNEVTRYPHQMLLVFNSVLYEYLNERALSNSDISAKCFYLDKTTQTLYLTLAFNLNELTYTQTVYFTIKHQLAPKADSHNMAAIKEEAIANYYDQAVQLTKESTYKVNGSLALSPPTRSVEVEFSVRMTSIDPSIDWMLESCWITENQCDDDELSQLSPHPPIIEPENHVQASDADEYMDPEFANDYDHHEGNPDYEHDQENASSQQKDPTDQSGHSKDPLNEFISKPEHDELKYNVTKYSSSVQATSVNMYEQTIEYSLTFASLNETHNQRILVCSLKPCANCKCSSNPRAQCDAKSKLVKYLADKKPVQMKTIKLTKLNLDELNKNSKIVIGVDSENMLVDLKCVNASQKDTKSKVSSLSKGMGSFKEFMDRHKLPLILLSLLIISIVITVVILHFFLKRYFICSKCFFKPKSGSRCHHNHHVNESFRNDRRGSSKNSMFRFSSEMGDDLTGNDEEAQLNLLVTTKDSNRSNLNRHADSNGKLQSKTSKL